MDKQFAIMPYEDYENMCDAVREKTGTTEKLSSADIGREMSNIESGAMIQPILEGTLKDLSNNKITKTKNYMFYCDDVLETVDLPNVEEVGERSFYNCKNIIGVNLPKATILGNGCFQFDENIIDIVIPNDINTIDDYCFSTCKKLEQFNNSFSEVVNLGKHAFYRCTELEMELEFPKIVTIPEYCFSECKKLIGFKGENVVSVGDYAFNECRTITNLYLPKVTSIGSQSFSNCAELKEAHFPLITELPVGAFSMCQKLEVVEFPLVTTVKGGAFFSCIKLPNILVLPKVSTIESTAFNYCQFETLDLPVDNITGTIATKAFHNCKYLKTLILRCENGLWNLENTDAFYYYCSIANNTGNIFVPRSKIEEYQTATNWTTYASQFRALEDYTVDGTITGEMDWDKINGGVTE